MNDPRSFPTGRSTRPRERLRIVNDGDIAGPRTRLLLGDEDITERLRVTRITLDLTVGEASKASLECICVNSEIDALLDDLKIRHLGSSWFGGLRWRLKKWWWRVRPVDVTAFGKSSRVHTLPGLRDDA